ncbi:transposase [Hymenobacter ruricola]|uniref:Transposase n=1 Tax=Hymenobacter ruricola TaxID=2791023 RepID=A0ABS0I0H8_9BACT|nr:transposase [Hymenobacter ruricola]MBF9220445.1 transposase [Hymenobacter ruricola]
MEKPALFREKYRVASTRLPGYDYAQSGAYFVTICVRDRQPSFGTVEVPRTGWDAAFVQPTKLGQRALTGWASIPEFAPFVTPDAFVLMPDHIHGILLFDKDEPSGPPASYDNHFGPQRNNLASVLRGFKSGVTTFARVHGLAFASQPRFHDRIIRSDDELRRIRDYILTNPSRWEKDWDNGEGLYR